MNDAWREPVTEQPTTHDRECAHGTDNPFGRCQCDEPCCSHRDELGWMVCTCDKCDGECGFHWGMPDAGSARFDFLLAFAIVFIVCASVLWGAR
jgi:hypothetical protein